MHVFVLSDSEGNRNRYLNPVSLTSVRVFVSGDSKANRIQASVPVLLRVSEIILFFLREKKAKLFQCTYHGSNISTRLSPCLVNTDTGFSRSRNWRLLRNETPARREPQPVIFILVIDSAPPYPEVTLCNSQNDKSQWLTKQDLHRDLFTSDLFWWWQCNVRNSLPLHCRLHPDITVMDDWVLKTIPFLSSPPPPPPLPFWSQYLPVPLWRQLDVYLRLSTYLIKRRFWCGKNYAQLDASWISHVLLYQWLFTQIFAIAAV